MKTFPLTLVAVSEEFLNFDAKMVRVPASSGYLGLVANHVPLMARLGLGLVRIITRDNKEHWYGVTGGFFEMMPDRATILADEIITPAEAVEREYLKNKPLYLKVEYSSQMEKSDLTRALLWRKLFGSQ